jgi:hypothetical protein
LDASPGLALWGAILGGLIYLRHEYGWGAGIGAAVALVVAANLAINMIK